MAAPSKPSKKLRNRLWRQVTRIAVENHAGDLLSVELVKLIEKAGPKFVRGHH